MRKAIWPWDRSHKNLNACQIRVNKKTAQKDGPEGTFSDGAVFLGSYLGEMVRPQSFRLVPRDAVAVSHWLRLFGSIPQGGWQYADKQPRVLPCLAPERAWALQSSTV